MGLRVSIREIEAEAQKIIKEAEDEAKKILDEARKEASKWRNAPIENPVSEEEIAEIRKEFEKLMRDAEEEYRRKKENILKAFNQKKEDLVNELVKLVTGTGD